MDAHPDQPATRRSQTAHLVLERRDGPRGRGLVYVAETEDAMPTMLATSAIFYPEVDLAAQEAALRELIVRLERQGWRQQPTSRPLTVIGARFRRR